MLDTSASCSFCGEAVIFRREMETCAVEFTAKISGSSIHGRGVIATRHAAAGERLFAVILPSKPTDTTAPLLELPKDMPLSERQAAASELSLHYDLTQLAAFLNHSALSTTAELRLDESKRALWCYALIALKPGDEVSVNYAHNPGFLSPPSEEWLN